MAAVVTSVNCHGALTIQYELSWPLLCAAPSKLALYSARNGGCRENNYDAVGDEMMMDQHFLCVEMACLRFVGADSELRLT